MITVRQPRRHFCGTVTSLWPADDVRRRRSGQRDRRRAVIAPRSLRVGDGVRAAFLRAPRSSDRACSSGARAFCPGDRACSSGTIPIEKAFPQPISIHLRSARQLAQTIVEVFPVHHLRAPTPCVRSPPLRLGQPPVHLRRPALRPNRQFLRGHRSLRRSARQPRSRSHPLIRGVHPRPGCVRPDVSCPVHPGHDAALRAAIVLFLQPALGVLRQIEAN